MCVLYALKLRQTSKRDLTSVCMYLNLLIVCVL